MKNIYKKVAALLCVAMISASVVGCGNTANNNNESAGSQVESTANENTENADAAEQEADKETDESTDAESNEDSAEETAETETASEEVPILSEAVEKSLGGFIGAEVTLQEIQDEKVWDIITTHFNAVTFGNELKPDALFGYSNGKCPGTVEDELNGETITVPKMDFSRAEKMLDKVLAWNEANPDKQLKVRGHVLVWHSQTPEWFFHKNYDKKEDYVSKAEMDKRQEWYIKTVLTHFTGEDSKYKGMFYGWDVVNEAISDGTGSYRTDAENPNEPLTNDTHGSNSSWWSVYQSNEYIINAFTYANKYAPADLELYYNDYNECVVKKMNGIVELLTAVKEREGEPGTGTRISAMGMQGHYNMNDPAVDKIELAMTKYAEVVGNVQITEFDLKASDSYDGSDEAKEKEYEKQKGRYYSFYWMILKKNEDPNINVQGITFWGTVDHYSWLQSQSNVGGGASGNLPQCPLLFDENYQPKPAFFAFIEQ